MDDRQQMQRHVKTEFNKLTETLTRLEKYLKLTRESGLEDSVKKIVGLREEIENSSKKILQDIEILYHHNSSPEKKLRVSTLLSNLDCGPACLKVDELQKDITKIVLRNLIPSHLWKPNLNGASGKLDYRVAIIGKTGSGKSSLANYMVGKNHFIVGSSSARVTTQFDSKLVEIEDKNVNVYDTPGFYDTNRDNNLAREQTLLAQKDGQGSGFDAFIFVVNYNAEMDARNIFRIIKDTHGNDIKNYTILVFNRMKGKVADLIDNSTEFRKICAEVEGRVIGVRCSNWQHLLPEERTQTCKKLLEMMQFISHAHKGKRFETGMMKVLKQRIKNLQF